ncbi:MAG TPA: hypothetical protein VK921_15810 [Anditalea sp.]|nr:hypothetical protein [Anditalea sp.]
MKGIIFILLMLSASYSYSQSPMDLFNAGLGISQNSNQDKLEKRWFSNLEVEFGINNEVKYDYSHHTNGRLMGRSSAELENKATYGILYSINYPVFNKFTVGAVGGFQHQVQQSISALKLGGIIRYHFVNYESVNINLMTAYNMALSNNIASQMANVRLGLQFPVKRTENLNINMNIFGDFNDYIFNEPILNEPTERPNGILFRSFGISLGIQF